MPEQAIGKPRRIRGKPTRAHLDKLAEIKREAARCFYMLGYAATDVRTIADVVGVQVSTLYNYISGKEELLYLIMKDGMSEITAGLDEAVAGLTDPRDRLLAAVRFHVIHHAHRQFRAWVGHVEVRSLTGEYLEEIVGQRREYERRWIKIIDNGISAGLFTDTDPRLTMYGILAIGQSVSRWYKPDAGYQPEHIADAMADLVLYGVLVRP
ncbi:MAG TPA: TetR/AcrR family transcriptional regulator [Trebonia sp.]|nr:TetR/AcrR family transcriptional regulator [Trebonia sp.]